MNESEKEALCKSVRAELYSISYKLDRLFYGCSPDILLTPEQHDLYIDLCNNLSLLLDALED